MSISLKGKRAVDLCFHPDPGVDIAVIPISIPVLRPDGIQVNHFSNHEHAADIALMSSRGITEGDPAFVLGFPMGMVGVRRNAVIVRSAAIARIRDTLAGHDNEFLVDAFLFPGNSGGPVVLKPELTAISGTKRQDQALLIGIVRANLPYQDVAISQQTRRARVVFEENTGLAVAHPVDCIQETIQAALAKFPHLQASRDAARSTAP